MITDDQIEDVMQDLLFRIHTAKCDFDTSIRGSFARGVCQGAINHITECFSNHYGARLKPIELPSAEGRNTEEVKVDGNI